MRCGGRATSKHEFTRREHPSDLDSVVGEEGKIPTPALFKPADTRQMRAQAVDEDMIGSAQRNNLGLIVSIDARNELSHGCLRVLWFGHLVPRLAPNAALQRHAGPPFELRHGSMMNRGTSVVQPRRPARLLQAPVKGCRRLVLKATR